MMKDKVKVIIFDADDTLWDNQTYFDRAEDVFTEELKEYGTAEELSEELYKTESANMPILGYGAKAVCISMMETALRVSDSKVPGENLSRILSSAKSLLSLPATPLPLLHIADVKIFLDSLFGDDDNPVEVFVKPRAFDFVLLIQHIPFCHQYQAVTTGLVQSVKRPRHPRKKI